MIAQEKIVILDYSTGEVFVYPISEREDAEDFFKRKNFKDSEIAWMRGNIKVHIDDEVKD